MKTTKFIPMIVAALLFFAGCTSSVNTVASDAGTPGYNSVPTRKILTDDGLKKKARVIDIRESRNASDLLTISVEIQNTTHSRKNFNYRVDWLDANGMSISSLLSSWKQKTLAGKETGFLTAVAPTPKASDFRLQLIEAK
ncbi:hypothetical protein KS4_15930 [Poriferisphaera corsica]|uniref:DUF1425 domain-containing protein n=1 Tax=Poriferisphaera corsica TaxID=2528020 RepID=A0A517YTI4_9BACT|nr:YcfL family protein [Poriferisphaera corsica]QDU33543.1 hypothetical protein KS4_15930 [Poriferisphaera corsica]